MLMEMHFQKTTHKWHNWVFQMEPLCRRRMGFDAVHSNVYQEPSIQTSTRRSRKKFLCPSSLALLPIFPPSLTLLDEAHSCQITCPPRCLRSPNGLSVVGEWVPLAHTLQSFHVLLGVLLKVFAQKNNYHSYGGIIIQMTLMPCKNVCA